MTRPPLTGEAAWLDKVRRARQEPWSGELALCMSCTARSGVCRLGIHDERYDGHELVALVVIGAEHEGGPGVAHGGTVVSILDEVLGHAVMCRGVMVVTATLTVDFLKPTPIEAPLLACARVGIHEGRRWEVTGELCLAEGEGPLARGRGTWVSVPDTHYARHRDWLANTTRSR